MTVCYWKQLALSADYQVLHTVQLAYEKLLIIILLVAASECLQSLIAFYIKERCNRTQTLYQKALKYMRR